MGHGSGNVNTVNNISSPVAVKKSKKKRRRSRRSFGSSSSLSSSSSSDSDEYVRRKIRHSRTSKRKSKKRRERDKSESRRNVQSLNTRFERQNDFSELNTNFMPVTVSGKQQIWRPFQSQWSVAHGKSETSVPAQPDVSINRQEEQFQMAVPSLSAVGEQANRSHSFTLNDLADIALLQS